MTVYHNAFPGDQIENWLELYAHRFQNPVFRSFQSELEVVYEEKNRGMDSPFNKLFEDLHKEMFRTHPYGTQSTIGTTEHLKSPSLTKMYEYFNTNYVANNMALVISGNFDKDKAIPVIKEKFSKLRQAEVPAFNDYERSQFNGKEIVEVKYTPFKIGLLGYKTFPKGHADEIAFDICTRILYNESETGLINKLQLDGNILFGGNIPLSYNDDGAYNILYAIKPVGQSFEEAEDLMYEAIQKVKDGNFSDKDLQIIKQEISRQSKEGLERSRDKAMTLVQLFSEGSTWEEYLAKMERIEDITKEDIQRVANKYFTENHLAFRSSIGFPKKDVLEKPGFEPVVNDQKEDSKYAAKFLANITAPENPRILDYEKDAKLVKIDESNKIYFTKNPINDLFSLKIQRAVGTDSIENLDYASQLFNYFYTKNKSRDELKEAFALLGITYYNYASGSRFTTVFNGSEKNLEAALPLIKELIYNPIAEQSALESIIENTIAGRESDLKDPETLGRYLLEFARFGKESEHLTRLPKKELKELKVEDILAAYKKVFNYDVTFHYVGKKENEEVKDLITNSLPIKNTNPIFSECRSFKRRMTT